jgi:hypothetical protein
VLAANQQRCLGVIWPTAQMSGGDGGGGGHTTQKTISFPLGAYPHILEEETHHHSLDINQNLLDCCSVWCIDCMMSYGCKKEYGYRSTNRKQTEDEIH